MCCCLAAYRIGLMALGKKWRLFSISSIFSEGMILTPYLVQIWREIDILIKNIIVSRWTAFLCQPILSSKFQNLNFRIILIALIDSFKTTPFTVAVSLSAKLRVIQFQSSLAQWLRSFWVICSNIMKIEIPGKQCQERKLEAMLPERQSGLWTSSLQL